MIGNHWDGPTFWVQHSHMLSPLNIIGAHLCVCVCVCVCVCTCEDKHIKPSSSSPPHLYLVGQCGVGIELLKQLIGSHVKDGDDLLWVSHQLGVEVGVEPTKMVTLDIEEGFLQQVDLKGRRKRGGRGGGGGGARGLLHTLFCHTSSSRCK